jgi:hypothetical protein
MLDPYDLLKIVGDSEPIRIDGAPTLDAATARVWDLLDSSPGDYHIFSQITGKKITITAHGVMKRD